MNDPLEQAIKAEATAALERLSSIAPSLHPLINYETVKALSDGARETAKALNDPETATEAAATVQKFLWPNSEPPLSFWKTEIGSKIAEIGDIFEGVTWSNSQAGEWLGIANSTVRPLKSKGQIETAEDGLLVAKSVIEYGKNRAWRRSK